MTGGKNFNWNLFVLSAAVAAAGFAPVAAESQHFDALWGSGAAAVALDELETAYTAAFCPDPLDYFQDSTCLNWFCGIFDVCSEGPYETTSFADLELVCDTTSALSKKCTNDLYLLQQVAKNQGSVCSDLIDLAQYTCTKNSAAPAYCGLDRYLDTVGTCTNTSTCCDFLYYNETDISSRCCTTDEYEGTTTCLRDGNLRFNCNNGLVTVLDDLNNFGPNLIREFCPALFDYDSKTIIGYNKWAPGCEDKVTSLFAGIFDLLGDAQVDAKAAAACTSCSKDLKAVEKLAQSYLSEDPSCSIISEGIAQGCAYDSYQEDVCIKYVPFLYGSDCNATLYSCCQDQLSSLFGTYSAAFGSALQPVLQKWYTIESYTEVCKDVLSFFIKTAGIESTCTGLVDVTEASVDFCPQLYNKTTGLVQNVADLSSSGASLISNFIENLGTGSVDGSTLCKSSKDDLAALVAAAEAAASSDETCSILSVLAKWSCMKDSKFLFDYEDDYYCADATLISDSSDCGTAAASCCQDTLQSLLASAASNFTDAQKSAVDDVVFVKSWTSVCNITLDSSQTCFTPVSFCPELINANTGFVLTNDIGISSGCLTAAEFFFLDITAGIVNTSLVCDDCKSDFQKVVDYVSGSTDSTCKAVPSLYNYACTTDQASDSKFRCGTYSLVTDPADCADLSPSCCQVYLNDILSNFTSAADQASLISFWYTPSYDDVCGSGEVTISDSTCYISPPTAAPTTAAPTAAPTTAAPSASSPAPTAATPSGASTASIFISIIVVVCSIFFL